MDVKTGKRVRRYYSFKGNETAAKIKLKELALQGGKGELLDENTPFGLVLDAWASSLGVSRKTAERYKELVALYIRPHLGAIKLQALRAARLEQFYTDLREGRSPAGKADARALSPRTIGHIHRLVVQALSLAERDDLVKANHARKAKRPKIERHEVEILDSAQIREVLTKLRPYAQMYRLAAVGLATGLRRGELCALRWRDVDLDGAALRVEQSLEQTKAPHGKGYALHFKEPKTKTSRRTIALPASIMSELRLMRREQSEQRLRLGLGKEPEDALVFRKPDGRPLVPNSITTEWRRLVSRLELPKVSLHAWRHTHASQLIASGMDVLTISRRLGHSTPSITLDVYGHRFTRKDESAAAVFDAAFSSVLSQ